MKTTPSAAAAKTRSFHEGAAFERRMFLRKLARELNSNQYTSYQAAVLRGLLEWTRARHKRYSKRAGGL